MKNQYEVIIIGGGPAGLSAANILAKNHKNTLLIEKNKIIGPKVCAGGLTTKSLNLDIPLDITDQLFSSFIAHTTKGSYQRVAPKPFMSTVDRKKLGQHMLNKAKTNGAEIVTGLKVEKISESHITAGGKHINYKYLIGADGSLSMVRKYLGLSTKKIVTSFQYLVKKIYPNLELFTDTNYFGSGYGWIFPHQNFTSIGIYRDSEELRGKNLKQLCTEWCQKIGVNLEDARQESWIINYDYQGWHFGNIFLVGDAGGFASGLTGEGIYYAIISAIEAANNIINTKYRSNDIKKILAKKRLHENYLKLLKINKKIPDLVYNTIIPLSSPRWITNKMISFFFE